MKLYLNNIENTAFIYPGVNHGFHNNTTPRLMKPQLQYHGLEQSIFLRTTKQKLWRQEFCTVRRYRSYYG
jgi:hypothetical protein